MGGTDKAIVEVGGFRLIDIAIDRLATQVDEVRLVAQDARDTGLTLVADSADFQGPVAGIYGVVDHLRSHGFHDACFLTCPIDAPFFPADLVQRLSHDTEACAHAADDAGTHPTFAYWHLSTLIKVRPSLPHAPSLKTLCHRADSLAVQWEGSDYFVNINTPVDLNEARARSR